MYARLLHLPGERRAIELRAQMPLVSAGAKKIWAHLAYEGDWAGHPNGGFEFTKETFDSIVRNFESQENALPLTYEHPEKTSGQPVPAAGWIHRLEVRSGDDGKAHLWAHCELTDKAAAMVHAGEYRFCSVVVQFDSMDRVSGELIGPEMFEVGLTNTPFLDGQEPLRASRRTTDSTRLSMNPEKALAAVKKALMLEDGAGGDQIIKKLEAVLAFLAADEPAEDAPAEGETEEAPAEEAAASADDADTVAASDEYDDGSNVNLEQQRRTRRRLAEDEAVTEDAPVPEDALASEALGAVAALAEATGKEPAEVLGALRDRLEEVAALLAEAPAEGTPAEQAGLSRAAELKLSAAEAKTKALEAKLSKLIKDVEDKNEKLESLRSAEYERRIDEAIRDQNILAEHKSVFVALSKADPKAFEKALADAAGSPAVPKGTVIQPKSPEAPSGASDNDVMKRMLSKYKRAGFSEAKATELAREFTSKRKK